jgi:hypothetical protein
MNKLRESLDKELDSIFYENDNFLSKKVEMASEQCEQITDDFSVKFLDWYGGLRLAQVHGRTTTELQQYFKENVYGK